MPSITVFAANAQNHNPLGWEKAWTNPGNITSDDGNWANATGLAIFNTDGTFNTNTHYLRAAPASLTAIPVTATIEGIEIELERAESATNRNVVDNSVRLYKAGAVNAYVGNDKNNENSGEWQVSTGGTGNQEIVTYGGPTDLWGTTWTRNEVVNDLEFGISASSDPVSGLIAGGLDYIKFTIYYSVPLEQIATNTNVDWTGSGSISGAVAKVEANIDTDWTSSASILSEKTFSSNISIDWFGSASITSDFSFKWSIDHLEASTSHGFPSVYVQVDNKEQPVQDFSALVGASEIFERRLLEMPRLQEVQLDERSGLAGFQRVTLQADNSDGLLNGLDLQDSYVRIFFVDADGNDYKEFNGKVVDWTLSHTVTINVEDLDALAFTQDLPKRTLNDLVEAEKERLDTPETQTELTEFESSVVADDLGKPIPIVFGRAVKIPLLYVKADETIVDEVTEESKREYDYIIGEGQGLSGSNFQEVFTVYREDQALETDQISGFAQSPFVNAKTVNLEVDHARPDSWYKWWWCEILDSTGTNLLGIEYVESYDGDENRCILENPVTIGSELNPRYRLREWRFYQGDQAGPYAGYAFLRFKKRLGSVGSTDQLYADVNGLPDEANRVRAIESILSNPNWGLGLAVDSNGASGSFDTAASEISTDVGALTCEGAILNQTSATDIFQKLLSFRDMVLYKEGDVKISVDDIKDSSSATFGLGDETGYNNILNQSPSINFKHPDQKVKDLKVRYRKNNKENDTYLHEFTRSSSTKGVDETLDLPFIYDHETADRTLDYKRKRLASADRTLALDIGEDGKRSKRGNLVTVEIPSLGISSDWEVSNANVTPAGSNSLNLVPYSTTPYTYTSFTSEGGTLPIDEEFDIPPDFTNTPPEPVTGITVTRGVDVMGITGTPFMIVSWSPPTDGNYGGAEVSMKLSTEPSNAWKSKGIVDGNNLRIDGLVPGQSYIFLVESLNITKEFKGIGVLSTDQVAGGDAGAPDQPATPSATERLGKVIFKWTPNSEDDISHYVPTVYDAQTDGNRIAVLPIVQHDHNDPFFSPEIEYQANQSALTSTNNPAWLEVVAVNYTLQESLPSFRGGVSSTTPVNEPDIADDAITDSKVKSLSASKITTGSLIANKGAGVAIEVTGAGALEFSGGGDIDLKATPSDTNFIIFRNSNNDIIGFLTYEVSPAGIILQSQGSGQQLILRSVDSDTFVTADNGDLFLRADNANGQIQLTGNHYRFTGSGSTVEINGTIDSNLIPTDDSIYNLGSSNFKWATVYRDAEGDIPMRNAFVITEPDMVYKEMDRDEGLFIMCRTNHIEGDNWEWKPVIFFDKEGKIHCQQIETDTEFKKPDYPYRGNMPLDPKKAFYKTNKKTN